VDQLIGGGAVQTPEQSMRDWKRYLDEFTPATGLRHEATAIRVCQLATRAAELGTYGVGAVLLDGDGEVVVEGHNEVHVDQFRSDLHAEMVVMNAFETARQAPHDLGSYTLITSLEPCPMCMTRLIFAGVGTVLHVCADPIGGMVQRKASLPPVFRQITQSLSQVWGLADCSPRLREAAFEIWDGSRQVLDRRLISRGGRRAGET
jgi:cytosine deaminase